MQVLSGTDSSAFKKLVFSRTSTIITVLRPISGTTRVSRCQKRTFGLYMVQGKINRGRHTDHPAGCHSIRTNQCPPPPSPIFLQAECSSCRPTNSVKALKARTSYALKIYKNSRTCKDLSVIRVNVMDIIFPGAGESRQDDDRGRLPEARGKCFESLSVL